MIPRSLAVCIVSIVYVAPVSSTRGTVTCRFSRASTRTGLRGPLGGVGGTDSGSGAERLGCSVTPRRPGCSITSRRPGSDVRWATLRVDTGGAEACRDVSAKAAPSWAALQAYRVPVPSAPGIAKIPTRMVTRESHTCPGEHGDTPTFCIATLLRRRW